MIRRWFADEESYLFCMKLAALALFIRFCLGAAYYNYFIYHLRSPLYAFDGEAYSIVGWYIALVLKGVNVFQLPHFLVPSDYAVAGGLFGTIASYAGELPPIGNYGVGLYTYCIGLFYYVFGYAPVLARFCNSIISVLSAFLVFDIARRVFSERVARMSFVVMLFNPSFIIYSSSLQRDVLVNFLVLLVLSEVLKAGNMQDRNRVAVSVCLSVAGMVLLSYLRVNAMLVLGAFIAAYAYMHFLRSFRRLTLFCTFAIFMIPILCNKIMLFLYSKLVLMLNYHRGLTFLGGYTYQLLPDRYYAVGLTGEKLWGGINIIDLAVAFFKGMTAFFLEPSPFTMYKVTHYIALPQALIWYGIVAFAGVGIYRALRSPTIAKGIMVVLIVLFTVSIGLSEANAETLLRHRDMVVPLYILFAAVGFETLGDGKERLI